MTQAMAKRFFFTFASILAAAFVCLFSGCGSEGAAPDEAFTSSESLGDLDPVESLIFSEEYAGYLVVHLKEFEGFDAARDTQHAVRTTRDARLPDGQAQRATSDERQATVEKALEAHPTATLKRVIKASPEAADARHTELEKLSGKKLADMNSIFRIDVADPAEAVKLYRELKNLEDVDKVYPYQKGHPMSIDDVPDLTPYQLSGSWGYLGDLNVQAAWDDEVHGENAVLVDGETDWSFTHEDLSIGRHDLIGLMYCEWAPGLSVCPSWINHGTAVSGIMAALPNDHGITGIAYAADMVLGFSGEALLELSDGVGEEMNEELPGGAIVAIEIGVNGALSDPADATQYGGLPAEAMPVDFIAISQATAAGITVLSAAANGSINLGNPAVYLPLQVPIIPENDSGSIIVGSSWGATLTGPPYNIPNRTKRADSNCGSRVNSFAWGHNVMTTGYPYAGNPYVWNPISGMPDPNVTGDPNAYFINNFGGTSAATAMVAGAAALIQSYAKRELAEIAGDSALVATRYLMPLKMREILIASGVPQVGGGCNIGKQPDIGAAMRLVDSFVSSIVTAYPEVADHNPLTEERMIALRRAGVGIVCKPADVVRHSRTGESDSACPEIALWPENNYIAKDLDFDGDGRADLVQWTNGAWKLDLSSRGSGGDNFGNWDVEVSYPPVVPTPMPSEDDGRMMAVPAGEWVWPYVNDMNSDGRTDFVVYNRWNGEWLISYTDANLIAHADWRGWDRIIDYSNEWHDELKLDPLSCTTGTGRNCTNYSRPAIGDYDGDGQNDIAIAASDGNWYISHDWREHDGTGHYDQVVRYLSDEQLAQAPGWAYLAVPMNDLSHGSYFTYKVPDGLPEEGRVVLIGPDFPDDDSMTFYRVPYMFGGNDQILLLGWHNMRGGNDFGLKSADGNWKLTAWIELADFPYQTLLPPANVLPSSIYGDSSCHPVVGDFDNNRKDDRAVMCPDGWRIGYSGEAAFPEILDPDGARRVPLGYDPDTFSLPGRPYAGGISYATVQRLISFFERTHPGVPPPIPVDMGR